MAYLFDSNNFLRLAEQHKPERQLVLNAIRKLRTNSEIIDLDIKNPYRQESHEYTSQEIMALLKKNFANNIILLKQLVHWNLNFVRFYLKEKYHKT